MTPYIIGYIVIGLLFTLWLRRNFDWVPNITPAKRLVSVLITTFAWWVVMILIALDA
jgi:hypothetical protein